MMMAIMLLLLLMMRRRKGEEGEEEGGADWHAAKLIIRVQRENALKYHGEQDSEGEW